LIITLYLPLWSRVCISWYCSHKGKTPLLCAAEAGHDEIVAYLLEFREVQTYLKNQPSVVMSANVSYIQLHWLCDILP